MPRLCYAMSPNIKAQIPLLYHENHCVKEICHILCIKKSLIYRMLSLYSRYGTVINPSKYFLFTGGCHWVLSSVNTTLISTVICYNFFPLPHPFPHLHSTMSLLLLCSLLPRDWSVLTHFPVLFLSSCTSSLVLPCSTGLSHSLVTSLMVTVFPLPSIEFYDLPLR